MQLGNGEGLEEMLSDVAFHLDVPRSQLVVVQMIEGIEGTKKKMKIEIRRPSSTSASYLMSDLEYGSAQQLAESLTQKYGLRVGVSAASSKRDLGYFIPQYHTAESTNERGIMEAAAFVDHEPARPMLPHGWKQYWSKTKNR